MVSAKDTILEKVGRCHSIVNLILCSRYLPFIEKFHIQFLDDRTEPLIYIEHPSLLGDAFWDEETFYVTL